MAAHGKSEEEAQEVQGFLFSPSSRVRHDYSLPSVSVSLSGQEAGILHPKTRVQRIVAIPATVS